MTRKSRYLLIATFVAASVVAGSTFARFGASSPDDGTYLARVTEALAADMEWEAEPAGTSTSVPQEPQSVAPSSQDVPYTERFARVGPMEIAEPVQAF